MRLMAEIAGRAMDRAYVAANTVVAVALLVMAGFFWWQLFGSLGRQLWSIGPVGIHGTARRHSRRAPPGGALAQHRPESTHG